MCNMYKIIYIHIVHSFACTTDTIDTSGRIVLARVASHSLIYTKQADKSRERLNNAYPCEVNSITNHTCSCFT